MRVIRTVKDLRQAIRPLKQEQRKLAFVPTMGALHEGHMSLVRTARNMADAVVVSIFVNPRQFGPQEDLAAYPRPEIEDLAKLSEHNVDIAYIPSVEEMYSEGFSASISVAGISAGLCGAHRPGHFDGVALVVTKLLLQSLPDIAIFGEKDYQQLLVIQQLVNDLNIPVEIISAPIFREKDGLALSSRNAYLTAEERGIAPALYHHLQHIASELQAGGSLEALVAAATHSLQATGFNRIDYIALRDARTLQPLLSLSAPARLLAAVYLGKCRLIDNIAVTKR